MIYVMKKFVASLVWTLIQPLLLGIELLILMIGISGRLQLASHPLRRATSERYSVYVHIRVIELFPFFRLNLIFLWLVK
jgi:hypothetical protein